MRSAITQIAALGAVTQAGSFFSDIRPRSYKKGRNIDIHRGNLYSPDTLTTHDMYFLNYCDSVKKHVYDDDTAELDESPDYEKGVTMWDTDLKESFFTVSRY